MPRPPAPRALRPAAGLRAARARLRTSSRGPGAVLRTLAAGCAVLAAAVSLLTGWGAAPLWALPVLAAAVACAELADRPRRGRRRPTSFVEAAVGAALVVGPGAWVVVGVGLGVVVAQRVRTSPRAHREAELAHRVLAAALGSALCLAVGPGVAAACAGTAAFWLVGCALTALAVSITSRRPLRSLLASQAPRSAPYAAAGGSAGVLAAFLALHTPVALAGLAVPVAVLWSTRDRTGRGGEARMLAELAREPGRTPDASAALLVTAAARLLGGADVELVVLTPDGPVCFAGDERPASASRSAAALDEPWIARALRGEAAQLGRAARRPYVTTVLGRDGRPLAVLRAQRGVDAPDFDRRELRLADVLGRQAVAWLHEPERPGAREGQDGLSAAYDGVRSAAERLAALAARAADVDDVVGELHALERSVASLLGVRALAARGDARPPVTAPAAVPAGLVPGPRQERAPAVDWTTTGVLR